MHVYKRTVFLFFLFVLTFFLFVTAKLPFYIYKPGEADELSQMVEVDSGYKNEGKLHLVTVSGNQATPIQYLIAKLATYQEITPIEEALPKDFTEEEYRYYQLKMMENSKDASKVVAYRAANKHVEIEYNGVYVIKTIKDMPAAGKIQVGDKILSVDNQKIHEPSQLVEYIETRSENETVNITFERDDEVMEVEINVERFSDENERVGIGVQVVADRTVQVEPKVNIKSGNIGGPSAGLMFSLEIYNQLVDEDITKGYNIAGTGEIDFSGNVGRIGGVDKKVVAAHRKGIDIFFVPFEKGEANSNYEIAKQTATEIKTEMKIVPIDSFAEALHYLNQLEPKR